MCRVLVQAFKYCIYCNSRQAHIHDTSSRATDGVFIENNMKLSPGQYMHFYKDNPETTSIIKTSQRKH